MEPLDGIHVVTLALNAPGPMAAARLRAAGARVTKVEPPSGDPLIGYCRGWYDDLHAGLVVERLDLKTDGGRQRMRELLSGADLFLASQRPSALKRLGLDADSLLSANPPLPRLRWLNIVGERAAPEIPGHDLTYLAKAGLLGGEMPRTVFADVLAGAEAYAAALLLLREPPGAHAEVGLYDALAPAVAPLRHGLTGPGRLLGGAQPAYGIYETRVGRVAVAALETHFHERLYRELGLPPGSDLHATFLARTATEWEEWAAERDLPLVRVREMRDEL